LALLPIGYGKSFSFQMLVLVQDYLAKKAAKERSILLVISPLVGLIKAQIVEIEALGLSASNFEDLPKVPTIISFSST